MKNTFIYLVIGTIATLSFVFATDFNFNTDKHGLFKGILIGWITAAWFIVLIRKYRTN